MPIIFHTQYPPPNSLICVDAGVLPSRVARVATYNKDTQAKGIRRRTLIRMPAYAYMVRDEEWATSTASISWGGQSAASPGELRRNNTFYTTFDPIPPAPPGFEEQPHNPSWGPLMGRVFKTKDTPSGEKLRTVATIIYRCRADKTKEIALTALVLEAAGDPVPPDPAHPNLPAEAAPRPISRIFWVPADAPSWVGLTPGCHFESATGTMHRADDYRGRGGLYEFGPLDGAATHDADSDEMLQPHTPPEVQGGVRTYTSNDREATREEIEKVLPRIRRFSTAIAADVVFKLLHRGEANGNQG